MRNIDWVKLGKIIFYHHLSALAFVQFLICAFVSLVGFVNGDYEFPITFVKNGVSTQYFLATPLFWFNGLFSFFMGFLAEQKLSTLIPNNNETI